MIIVYFYIFYCLNLIYINKLFKKFQYYETNNGNRFFEKKKDNNYLIICLIGGTIFS